MLMPLLPCIFLAPSQLLPVSVSWNSSDRVKTYFLGVCFWWDHFADLPQPSAYQCWRGGVGDGMRSRFLCKCSSPSQTHCAGSRLYLRWTKVAEDWDFNSPSILPGSYQICAQRCIAMKGRTCRCSMFTPISWMWDFNFLRKSAPTILEMPHGVQGEAGFFQRWCGCWTLNQCKPLGAWWWYRIQLELQVLNVWKSIPELFWKRVPVRWLIFRCWPFVSLNPFVVVLPLNPKSNPVFLSSLCFSLTPVLFFSPVFCLWSPSVLLPFFKI